MVPAPTPGRAAGACSTASFYSPLPSSSRELQQGAQVAGFPSQPRLHSRPEGPLKDAEQILFKPHLPAGAGKGTQPEEKQTPNQ